MMLRNKIVCADGLTVSVQASSTHYCTPRDNAGPYSTVELGFPSQTPPPAILAYAEDKDKPTDTVYGYVPVNLVSDWLKNHGGELPEDLPA